MGLTFLTDYFNTVRYTFSHLSTDNFSKTMITTSKYRLQSWKSVSISSGFLVT
jgi:hypothetical protein